ncbi:MAG: outer membrane protein assembly factor BamC [Candidatus Thiodiazotropha sp. (ex Myrtea sp. 'scaly one' KF741663)]|nr:outer membrane protein assembly factor BamC [Candidatus Thiodiazotropha sp. (ex Myrtea sp. 'scaly one' KF741663)]
MQFILYPFSILLLLLMLTGCSSNGGFFSDSEREYRKQRETVQDLEVPPDLTRSAIQDAMVVPGAGGASYEAYTQRDKQVASGVAVDGEVLPDFENLSVQRDGDQRWLVIQGEPQQVWPKVVDFWRKNGLLLVEQDPAIGVMKTDWLESRVDIKQGAITEFFRKAVGGVFTSATRDQFRVRLEPGLQPGTTELYLTHRGMEEKLVENVSGEADTTYWTPRPNDPGIEAAMLRSLMLHLGVTQEQAETLLAQEQEAQPRSRLVKNAQVSELYIRESFARAWRLTGVALDRVGFAVEDRDRSAGIYYVRYNQLESDKAEKKGFFSKLAFWRDDESEIDDKVQYQVKLTEFDDETQVIVRDQAGERDNAEIAQRILTLINEQIR